MTKQEKKEYDKIRYFLNKEKFKKWNKKWMSRNKEKRKKYKIEYRQKNKRKIDEYQNFYNEKNKEKRKKYHKENKEKRNKYRRHLRIINFNYRILENLRSRLYIAIKNNSKSAHTMELLGCSIDELKEHLKSKFVNGMSWKNYGKWHIDHIRPCASFDMSDPEQQRECFNYKNLQPLWAEDNWKKHNTY